MRPFVRGVLTCLAGAPWLAVAGCGGEESPPGMNSESTPLEAQAPEEVLAGIEGALMMAEGRTVEFQVASEGAFPASLEGRLVLGVGEAVDLEASGLFGADSITLWLRTTDGRMTWGHGPTAFEDQVPAALREAVVIGLVRMGVLHNLARLVSGAPPDRADGSARSWVEVEDAAWVRLDPEEGAHGISFGIRVAGQSAATATAWLDQDGRLVGRRQVVQFPGGEMQVRERYLWRE